MVTSSPAALADPPEGEGRNGGWRQLQSRRKRRKGAGVPVACQVKKCRSRQQHRKAQSQDAQRAWPTHDEVVDNDDGRALGDRALLALERVRAVLELVRDRNALAGQLALLPHRHERAPEPGRQDRPEQEPAARGGGGSASCRPARRGEMGESGYRASRPTITSIFLLGVVGMVLVKRWLRKWVETICQPAIRPRCPPVSAVQLCRAPRRQRPPAPPRLPAHLPRTRSGPPGSGRCRAAEPQMKVTPARGNGQLVQPCPPAPLTAARTQSRGLVVHGGQPC